MVVLLHYIFLFQIFIRNISLFYQALDLLDLNNQKKSNIFVYLQDPTYILYYEKFLYYENHVDY